MISREIRTFTSFFNFGIETGLAVFPAFSASVARILGQDQKACSMGK